MKVASSQQKMICAFGCGVVGSKQGIRYHQNIHFKDKIVAAYELKYKKGVRVEYPEECAIPVNNGPCPTQGRENLQKLSRHIGVSHGMLYPSFIVKEKEYGLPNPYINSPIQPSETVSTNLRHEKMADEQVMEV